LTPPPPQPVEQLTAYITYARNKIHPVISEPAGAALVKAYVEMRKVGEDPRSSERRITATTRQLESMIRLSEAHARMRFSDSVDLEDVKEAGRLIREAIRESATDPITGQIDLDLINTGAGQQQRRVAGDLKRAITQLIDASGNRGLRWSEALKKLEEQSSIVVDNAEFSEVVRALEVRRRLRPLIFPCRTAADAHALLDCGRTRASSRSRASARSA
jgi:DNA replication licensing factor MCM4